MKNKKINLNNILKISSFVIAFAVFSIFIMGLQFVSSYFSTFNVESSIFSFQKEKYLLYGIVNLMSIFTKILGSPELLTYFPLGLVALTIGMYIHLLIKNRKLKKQKKAKTKRIKLMLFNDVLEKILTILLIPFIIILLIIYFYVDVVILSPKKLGKEFAREVLISYKKEIRSDNHKLDIIVLKNQGGEQRKLRGKIIIISSEVVAFYDGEKTKVYPFKSIDHVESDITNKHHVN